MEGNKKSCKNMYPCQVEHSGCVSSDQQTVPGTPAVQPDSWGAAGYSQLDVAFPHQHQVQHLVIDPHDVDALSGLSPHTPSRPQISLREY